MDGEGLPWRPLTVAELLDAATAVLRARPVRLLLWALALAAAEQALLLPIRAGLGVTQHDYAIGLTHRWWATWLVVALGAGTEAVVLGVLGAVAAGSARGLLLSDRVRAGEGNRPFGVAVLSVLTGAGAFLCMLAAGLPWLVWFALTGMATPVLVTDARRAPRGPGHPPRRMSVPAAFGRSLVLSAGGGLRAGYARLLTYLGWSLVRVLLAYLGLLVLRSDLTVPVPVEYAVWVIVNTVMYASIAGFDAAAHLEARIRLEGLDLALHRAVRTRTPAADALVAP
jgi:hypothetical protein